MTKLHSMMPCHLPLNQPFSKQSQVIFILGSGWHLEECEGRYLKDIANICANFWFQLKVFVPSICTPPVEDQAKRCADTCAGCVGTPGTPFKTTPPFKKMKKKDDHPRMIHLTPPHLICTSQDATLTTTTTPPTKKTTIVYNSNCCLVNFDNFNIYDNNYLPSCFYFCDFSANIWNRVVQMH